MATTTYDPVAPKILSTEWKKGFRFTAYYEEDNSALVIKLAAATRIRDSCHHPQIGWAFEPQIPPYGRSVLPF